MHMYSLEALCPLSVPLTLPVVLSLWWLCVLSCSGPVERAGLVGGGAGGKEGPHPWKLCGDAVALDGNIYGQVITFPGRVCGNACSSTLKFTVETCLSKTPEFTQASDCTVCYYCGLFSIHTCHAVPILTGKWSLWCMCKHDSVFEFILVKYSRAFQRFKSGFAFTTFCCKHPGYFVAAPENERLSVEGLTLPSA